jgi:hypothetical protein
MNGGNVFGGGQFRRQAKREAIDASLKRERSNRSQQYVAEEAMRTEKDQNGDLKTVPTGFGKKLAGAGPLGGGADAAAIQSALANAQFTIDEAIAKEIKAESVMVRNMDPAALKRILDPVNSTASEASKAAAMQRLIRVSDAGDFADEVNSAMAFDATNPEKGSVLRRATAEALANDGPGFIKASDVDRIATGKAFTDGDTIQSIARKNTDAGVLSAEKLVGESAGNIKFAFDQASTGPDGGMQKMINAAYEAKSNPQLSGKIKHNIVAINNVLTPAKHVADPSATDGIALDIAP